MTRNRWREDIVDYWRAYVPPCRPSRFELDVCSDAATTLRKTILRTPQVLILGSTVEFRDWAFEEACEVTVVDNSPEFHHAISDDRRYKIAHERVVFESWETLTFQQEFDLVLGDLVVGNVAPADIKAFVNNVHAALRTEGMFITKSFFFDPTVQLDSLIDIFALYERSHQWEDPFPHLAYPLTIHSMDTDTKMLSFGDMFTGVQKGVEEGVLLPHRLERYKQLGWHTGKKIEFYVMPLREWEDILAATFRKVEKKYGSQPWSRYFPVYVATK